MTKPIVFLGPSLPHADAQRLLEADYRPPIRRGDLGDLEPGAVVALIDGVFEQDLSVSPREIEAALARDVRIFGGSSMGALRAAEVPGVTGIGLVYAWYRDSVISRDDEVALLFDPASHAAVSVPLVNVRFAVDRLVRPGTIDAALGRRLVEAALSLPYERRSYRAILRVAGLSAHAEADGLVRMLEAHDLKREDAQAVLEHVARFVCATPRAEVRPTERREASAAGHTPSASSDALVVWESGDAFDFEALVEFLAVTGKLRHHARRAIARFLLEGNELAMERPAQPTRGEAQTILDEIRSRWGWVSQEETRVTLADLGVDLPALEEHIAEEATARSVVEAIVRAAEPEFLQALRVELLSDDLALKRELMRLGALRHFQAAAGDALVSTEEIQGAKQTLCKVGGCGEFERVRASWAALGVSSDRADAFVTALARARHAARALVEQMRGRADELPATPTQHGPEKPEGEPRFSCTLAQARAHAEHLAEVIGVTRVGYIAELSNLGGVQIAQAARPDNAWSSSYGSGKGTSREGAYVGAIMEETEKWAQEQFAGGGGTRLRGSYASLRARHPLVDPQTLDLPFDSCYEPNLELDWCRCANAIDGGELWVPANAVEMKRAPHDIYYSARGGRKVFATNGLGSGFTREEAVLHAVCEFVERHAARLAELLLANPGGLGTVPHGSGIGTFIDPDTCSGRVRGIVAGLRGSGATVRVLDITADVRIPTFIGCIVRDGRRALGQACHPNPDVAAEMALLEAAQTISSAAAGGREDLSIHARSLGRHERPQPVSMRDAWFWFDPDAVLEPVDRVDGLVSRSVAEDLVWCRERLRRAGLSTVPVVDLGHPAIAPAHVVRVMIPGLESNSPFFTGSRARLILLRDMLPRWR